jgi:hypothetical protein
VSDLRITVDGSERQVAAGTTAAEVFEGDRLVIAARVGGELRDLAHVLSDGDVVEPVAIDSADGRSILRHSTAHVMAQAVQALHPTPGSASARRSRTASTTTSTSRCRSPPTTSPRSTSGCSRSSRRASRSYAGWSPTTRPALSWPSSRTSWS